MPFGPAAFLTAFVASVILAPLVARFARRVGLLDQPDDHRKLHERPIPLTGGPTILISAIVAVTITLWLYPGLLKPTVNDAKFLASLFVSGGLIVAIGMIDDRYGLRGRQKLAGQILAALVLLPSGIIVREVSGFGVTISFGDLAPLMTLLWLVGAINALNLIDGVDGLASTTGIVLSLSVAAVLFILGGRPDGLMISLILAGALSGFLIFNFPPARMFLGDSGSMLIGLILGAIALKCSIKQYAAMALILPTAIWAIPMFDVAMAIVRRKLTGRSIYTTDRGHLHHCLARKGVDGVWLLVLMALLCAITGMGAVVATYTGRESIAYVGVGTSLSLLVLTRSFGHTEMSLLTNRLRRLTGSMLRRSAPDRTVLYDEEIRLNGDYNWQQLWETLTQFAERFEMDTVELMVNLPLIGEEYHASWKRKTKTEAHEEWKSEIPLIVQGMRVGHLRVAGAVGEGSICKWMSDLIGGLEAFEFELASLIQELRREKLGITSPPSEAETPTTWGDLQQFALK
ncbi:MAG TPA: undecaprenyl/decaprenyl-phosphate alpha-N-acetylglucosaminyl 1-phosphate transferase [Fuerstia sp.]|nr:undecaprenyl/decaprenyl-phosphate alpha-N-acetylglucosaminyl 1-phosphate transferase [Fuerstiella sp.]